MATSPVFAGAINVGHVQILPADTTSKKTLFTAGASGSFLKALSVASDDSAGEVVQVWITNGGTDYLLGNVAVPIGAGGAAAGTTPAVDLLNNTIFPGLPVDNDGQHYVPMKSGDVLKVSAVATITTAKTLHFTALGEDI